MLRTVKVWQHALVGVSILVMVVIGGFGILGAGDEAVLRPEHFDAKQITVWPDGDAGVRVREVVDIDFGLTQRHGYQRVIPNDYGVPTDVTASAPGGDADDSLSVVAAGTDTRIRIGDPSLTITGRHRYVLEYTLPDAHLSDGVLALDVIGTDETFETERFVVVLAGFEFTSTECHTGGINAFGGCAFERQADGTHVAVIAPLAPGDGVTVGGRFAGVGDPTLPHLPEQPSAIPAFRLLGLLMIPLGLAAAAAVYLFGRSYGSNVVAGAGAADAAFGDLPLPGQGAVAADVATYRVPDSRLAEMATVEFSPPRGLEPWQASVLLREELDDATVSAWFSEMIANDAIAVVGDGKDLRLRRGEGTARLSGVDQGHIARLFAAGDEVQLGEYSPAFTASWNAIRVEQQRFVRNAGWWSRGGPGGGPTAPVVAVALAALVAAVSLGVAVYALAASGAYWRVIMAPWVAVVVGVAVPMIAATLLYRSMFASRTATGSALALRSESFRRFLEASEGRHVEWAWQHGLLREYSAWAVALGAAEAWSKAIESSNVPDPSVALAGPLIIYTSASLFSSTHTAPSSSGGGSSSGGFGGGGVGGGGGGGSSGSW